MIIDTSLKRKLVKNMRDPNPMLVATNPGEAVLFFSEESVREWEDATVEQEYITMDATKPTHKATMFSEVFMKM